MTPNSVVLNKRVGGIFFSHFKDENACWWEIFKSFFLQINRRMDMPNNRATRVQSRSGLSGILSNTK